MRRLGNYRLWILPTISTFTGTPSISVGSDTPSLGGSVRLTFRPNPSESRRSIPTAISPTSGANTSATLIFARFASSSETPFSQLHYIWDHGRSFSFIPAFRAGSVARTVALLAIIAYIAQFSSSPLLQRSTHKATEEPVTMDPLSLDVATRIPDGWFGTIEHGKVVAFRRGLLQIQ